MPILSTTPRHAGEARYTRVYIPLGTLVTAWEFLRANGVRGQEQLCYLVGRPVTCADRVAAQVTACVLPMTSAAPDYVTLTSHAQTGVILDALEARAEKFLMALHTHPDGGAHGGPAHSTVDDHGVALTPADGVFSAVIPHYALGSPFLFPECAGFHERVEGVWRRLARDEVAARIHVHGETLRLVPGATERA